MMNRFKINKVLFVIIGVVALGMFIFPKGLKAQDTFEIQPPQSTEVHQQGLKIGGRDFAVVLYDSTLSPVELTDYYRVLFAQEGFALISDEEDGIKRFMRFRQGDFVINIALLPKGSFTRVGVAEYFQPQGAPDPGKLKPTWDEIISMIPKTDLPGEDLPEIPRPPEGLRLLGAGPPKEKLLVYTSPVSVGEVKEFYDAQMPSYGWYETQEASLDDMLIQQERMKGQRGFGVPLPFVGVSMEGIIEGGYILQYRNEEGASAKIQLLNLDPQGEGGSMIHIRYVAQ